MIVVDINLIGYLFLSSDYSSQAEAALLKDVEWATPLLMHPNARTTLIA